MTIERLLDAGRAFEAGRLDDAERVYRQVAEAEAFADNVRMICQTCHSFFLFV